MTKKKGSQRKGCNPEEDRLAQVLRRSEHDAVITPQYVKKKGLARAEPRAFRGILISGVRCLEYSGLSVLPDFKLPGCPLITLRNNKR